MFLHKLFEIHIKAIYHQLCLISPSLHFSFVVHQNKIFWTIPFDPFRSSVVTLIQNIFEKYKDQSFFILRNRIYTTDQFHDADLGIIKILAKKGTDQLHMHFETSSIDDKNKYDIKYEFNLNNYQFNFIEPNSIIHYTSFLESNNSHLLHIILSKKIKLFSKNSHLLFQNYLFSLLSTTALINKRGSKLHMFHRSIAAIMLDKNNCLISYGINSNAINKSLHAEIIMIDQGIRNINFNKNCFDLSKINLYLTHQPCRMCSSYIYKFTEMYKIENFNIYFQYSMPGASNQIIIPIIKERTIHFLS